MNRAQAEAGWGGPGGREGPARPADKIAGRGDGWK